jgi:LysM repeat protein
MGAFPGVDGSTGGAQAYVAPQDEANAPSPNNFGDKVEAQQREYVVRKGQSMWLIARQNGITLKELLALNTQFDPNSVDKGRSKKRAIAGKRDADQLRIGEKIFVPAASGTGVAGDGVAKPVNLPTPAGNTRVNESPYRAGNKPPQRSAQPQTAPAPQQQAAPAPQQQAAPAPQQQAAPAPQQQAAPAPQQQAAPAPQQQAAPAPQQQAAPAPQQQAAPAPQQQVAPAPQQQAAPAPQQQVAPAPQQQAAPAPQQQAAPAPQQQAAPAPQQQAAPAPQQQAAPAPQQQAAPAPQQQAAPAPQQQAAPAAQQQAAPAAQQQAASAPPAPNPDLTPPEVLPAAYKRYLLLTGSGSGSKDPRSADNRAGAIFESNDFGGNLNSGSYQFNASLTKPGRVQEPGARLDATARVSLFSAGRKPAKYLDAEGKEKTTEAFGLKLGGMNAKDRFMSVSAYANVSGVPIGAIEQETGKAVDGKSATSPLHIGPAVSIGGQSGGLTGYFAPGIGNGQIRNADGTISTTHTNIYGIDYGVTFAEKPKFALARLQAGMTGRRTVTTPEGGVAGKPTYANTFSSEAFFKFPGKIPSLLPGQPESRTNDAPGLFRIRLDTPFDKLDPKLTLRFDKPIWEIRNVVPTADGKLKVTSQFQMEAMGAAQFGLNSQKDPAVQNVVAGLRFRF